MYVGQGKIRTRLLNHRRSAGFRDIAFHVVYQKIDGEYERKLLERALIKHFDPVYNKEGAMLQEKIRTDRKLAAQFRRLSDDIQAFLAEYGHDELPGAGHHIWNLISRGFTLADIEREYLKVYSKETPEDEFIDFILN